MNEVRFLMAYNSAEGDCAGREEDSQENPDDEPPMPDSGHQARQDIRVRVARIGNQLCFDLYGLAVHHERVVIPQRNLCAECRATH